MTLETLQPISPAIIEAERAARDELAGARVRGGATPSVPPVLLEGFAVSPAEHLPTHRASAPVVDPGQFKSVLGHFASGVVVISALDGHEPVGFTCQSLFALSLDPPLIAIAPSRTSTSWPRIERVGHFCANVLAADQEPLARSFAVSRPDKFAGIEWAPGTNGAPRIVGALAWIDCSIEQRHDAGDHHLVVARVHDLEAGEGLPLLFYRAAFETFAGPNAPSEPNGA